MVNQPRVTIQGDPNVPASILPAYQLSIQTGLVKLGNLNQLFDLWAPPAR